MLLIATAPLGMRSSCKGSYINYSVNFSKITAYRVYLMELLVGLLQSALRICGLENVTRHRESQHHSDLMWYFDPILSGLITISNSLCHWKGRWVDETYGLKTHRASSWGWGCAACVNPLEACCHGFVASCTTSLLREFGDSWPGLQLLRRPTKAVGSSGFKERTHGIQNMQI